MNCTETVINKLIKSKQCECLCVIPLRNFCLKPITHHLVSAQVWWSLRRIQTTKLDPGTVKIRVQVRTGV